jgi:CBS domain-containing protein
MRVHHIMTPDVQSCAPETTIRQVARLMSEGACGIIPVVDAHGKVAGVVTDRDICMALVDTARRPADVPAREVMAARVYSCGPDDDVRSALETMTKFKVRRLPVIDADGRLRGMLSMDDIIVRALAPDAPTSSDIVRSLREIVSYREEEEEEPEVAALGG